MVEKVGNNNRHFWKATNFFLCFVYFLMGRLLTLAVIINEKPSMKNQSLGMRKIHFERLSTNYPGMHI